MIYTWGVFARFRWQTVPIFGAKQVGVKSPEQSGQLKFIEHPQDMPNELALCSAPNILLYFIWSLLSAMGIGPSSLDLTVPPGGQILFLMHPNDCVPTKPKLTDTQKPSCLSVDDVTWTNWHAKLSKILGQYWNEMIQLIPVISGFVCAFIVIGLLALLHVRLPVWAVPAAIAPNILIGFGLRCFICAVNESLDDDIRDLCTELSSLAVEVEYRTEGTEFLKPKHGRTVRLIAFVPAAAWS